MSELTKKTLQAITERKIRPVPLWVEWLKNSAYWGGGIFLVALSALTMGISWHALFEIDWAAYLKVGFSWGEILFSGVPLFSLAIFIFFLWGSIFLLHHTRRGYRYSMPLLTALFLTLSVASGYFLEGSPLDEPTERFLLAAFPQTKNNLIPSAKQQWSQPERGLLGGTVLSSDATDLQLLDSSQKLWTVDYSEAHFSPNTQPDSYEDVKVIGTQEKEDRFRAKEITSWKKTSREKEENVVRVESVKKREKAEESKKKEEQANEQSDDQDEEDTDDNYDEDD